MRSANRHQGPIKSLFPTILRNDRFRSGIAGASFHKLFDFIPSLLLIADRDGMLLHVNAACQSVFQFSSGELTGRSILDLVMEKDQKRTSEAIYGIRLSVGVIKLDNICCRKDLSPVPVKWSLQWDPAEELLYLSGEDLSERSDEEMLTALEKEITYLNMQPGISMQSLANTLLDRTEKLFPGSICSIMRLRSDNTLASYAAPSLPREYTDLINGVSAGPRVGSCGTAVYYDRVVIVSDIQKDPLWEDFKEVAARWDLKACWSVPIHHSKGRILGTFGIYHHAVKSPSESMLRSIERLANLIGLLVENSEILENLRLSEERNREEKKARQTAIMKATIGIQEKERNEIGNELHDNVNQILTSAKLYLECVGFYDDQKEEYRQKAFGLIDMGIEEIRRLSKSLVPPRLKDVGLVRSIQDILETILATSLLSIGFCHEEFDEAQLEDGLKLAIYRIVQEQTTNILKHAEAGRVDISLYETKDSLVLLIADDGKGFDPSLFRKGIGFTNISNRSGVNQGKMEIKSSPGNGCSLKITFRRDDSSPGEHPSI